MAGFFVVTTNEITSTFSNQVALVSHYALLSLCVFSFILSVVFKASFLAYYCLLLGTQCGSALLLTLTLQWFHICNCHL